MWANKCNYEQDVITIALLLKLLYTLMAWLTIYAEGWNWLLLSQEEKMPEVCPLLYYICENTTFKCRIWLSKNRTRKPFNRNSRERKLFKSWYSMKDYENGGHRMRRNCKYNEENLFPLCKYTGTIYSSLLSYQGIFSASGKRKGKKPPCPNGSIEWCAWLVPHRNGQLLTYWTRLPETIPEDLLPHSLLST